MYAKLLQLSLTLYDPMDCSLAGSSVHGILQEGILEWLPCPPPGDLPDPGIKPASLTLAGGFFFFFFTTSAPGKPPGKPVILIVQMWNSERSFVSFSN